MAPNLETPVSDERQGREPTLTLDEFLVMLRRRVWVLVGCVAFSLLLGAVYYLQAQPIYEVRSRLLVRSERLPLEEGQGPTRYSEEFLATQAQIILSRAVVEPVVQSLKWNSNEPTVKDPVKSMQSSLFVKPVSKTDVIEITFRSPQTLKAVRAVEELIESYRSYLGDLKQDTYTETLRVLTRTEEATRKDLEKLEEDYRKLREEGAVVGQGQEAVSIHKKRLADLDGKLNQATSRRVDLESRLQSLVRARIGAVTPEYAESMGADSIPAKSQIVLAAAGGPAASTIDDELAVLLPILNQLQVGEAAGVYAHLAELRAKWFAATDQEKKAEATYGLKHHLLQAARDDVKVWETRIRQQIDSVPSVLEAELDNARAYEASLSKVYEEQFAEAKRLDIRLLKEQQALAAVQRLQSIHDALHEQLQQLQLRGEAAVGGLSGVSVLVLANPELTPSPVWPSLPLLFGVCGIVGLAGGVVVAGRMAQRDTVAARAAIDGVAHDDID